jgi:hypothetical protein
MTATSTRTLHPLLLNLFLLNFISVSFSYACWEDRRPSLHQHLQHHHPSPHPRGQINVWATFYSELRLFNRASCATLPEEIVGTTRHSSLSLSGFVAAGFGFHSKRCYSLQLPSPYSGLSGPSPQDTPLERVLSPVTLSSVTPGNQASGHCIKTLPWSASCPHGPAVTSPHCLFSLVLLFT